MASIRARIIVRSDDDIYLLISMKFATGEGERKPDIRRVPILVVAHSTGSLVEKKAFILGHHDEHYKDPIRAISCIIVFFSTPCRGSVLAEALNRILSACISAFPPKQYISKPLLNPPTPQDINEQFQNRAPSPSIVSFFEKLKTVIGPY